MMYLGDFNPGDTVRFMWNTNDSNGASITRSTNGTISVYQNGNTTQSTTGVTDTEDFDGLTGVHFAAIDTSADGTFYAAGRDFAVVLSAATIDSRVVNAVIAHFSIQNRSPLRPTTAGRTLDVSAGGEAGVDWANIGSPTTAQSLSGTNIKTDQVVASVSGAVASVTAGVTVTTNNDKTGYGLSAAAVQAIWDALTAALTTAGSIGKLLVDNINATIGSRSTVTTAQVNAEVLDVLNVDTFAEPAAVPAATTTLQAMLHWIYTLARNERRTTATSDLVRNDANGATIGTATLSDDNTTFTRGEYS